MQPENFLCANRIPAMATVRWRNGIYRGKQMLGATANKYLVFIIVASAVLLAAVGNASAQSGQSVEDFYRGKQVRFITGYSAGGLFDSATRIFARHVGKFIPGNPNVWVD